jgi:hypothetical protein
MTGSVQRLGNMPSSNQLRAVSLPHMSNRLPNAIDRHVAFRLRSRRREAGITQEMLANALGVSFQQVQNTRRASTAYRRARCISWR